jgi:hypothetical protein
MKTIYFNKLMTLCSDLDKIMSKDNFMKIVKIYDVVTRSTIIHYDRELQEQLMKTYFIYKS